MQRLQWLFRYDNTDLNPYVRQSVRYTAQRRCLCRKSVILERCGILWRLPLYQHLTFKPVFTFRWLSLFCIFTSIFRMNATEKIDFHLPMAIKGSASRKTMHFFPENSTEMLTNCNVWCEASKFELASVWTIRQYLSKHSKTADRTKSYQTSFIVLVVYRNLRKLTITRLSNKLWHFIFCLLWPWITIRNESRDFSIEIKARKKVNDFSRFPAVFFISLNNAPDIHSTDHDVA